MTDPSALSGVLGFLLMGVIFYGLLRFVEWADPDPDWTEDDR